MNIQEGCTSAIRSLRVAYGRRLQILVGCNLSDCKALRFGRNSRFYLTFGGGQRRESTIFALRAMKTNHRSRAPVTGEPRKCCSCDSTSGCATGRSLLIALPAPNAASNKHRSDWIQESLLRPIRCSISALFADAATPNSSRSHHSISSITRCVMRGSSYFQRSRFDDE